MGVYLDKQKKKIPKIIKKNPNPKGDGIAYCTFSLTFYYFAFFTSIFYVLLKRGGALHVN